MHCPRYSGPRVYWLSDRKLAAQTSSSGFIQGLPGGGGGGGGCNAVSTGFSK